MRARLLAIGILAAAILPLAPAALHAAPSTVAAGPICGYFLGDEGTFNKGWKCIYPPGHPANR